MNASKASFARFLLAMVAIGSLAFPGCFLDSMGTAPPCPGFHSTLNRCDQGCCFRQRGENEGWLSVRIYGESEGSGCLIRGEGRVAQYPILDELVYNGTLHQPGEAIETWTGHDAEATLTVWGEDRSMGWLEWCLWYRSETSDGEGETLGLVYTGARVGCADQDMSEAFAVFDAASCNPGEEGCCP